MRTVLVVALAFGCRAEPTSGPDPDPARPIVIWWTVDTLGERAAAETGWCEQLTATLGAYGRDLACPGGAVPPASWTAESHTRTLWPEHMEGERRRYEKPGCESVGLMQAIAAQHEAPYVWGADNPVFEWAVTDGQPLLCDDGRSAWLQGADEAFASDGNDVMLLDEADTPVHAGLDAVIARVASGAGAVAYLNDFESGGHYPRCFMDPYGQACAALWDLAVAEGLVAADADRAEAWLQVDFERSVTRAALAAWEAEPERLREVYWATMRQSIEHFRADRFLPRLERLLAELERSDRLGDLVLVVAGDHGENPCVPSEVTGEVNCDHFGLPNEWTGRVPVYVSPAAWAERWRADGLIGDRDTPWALPNLSYGLLSGLGADIPSSWPAPTPLGAAHAWTCRNGAVTATHVSGAASVRCELDRCGAWSWEYPEELAHEPLPLAIPDDLAAYAAPVGAHPNWAMAACE